MTIIPKTVELDEKEKDTLLSALKIINEFENKTAYQIEFEDEHNICWNTKECLEDFLVNICDIEI
jgi:hypothetical protein